MLYKYVYKSIAALVALCVFPLTIYAPMIYAMGEVAIGKTSIYDEMSLYRIYFNFLRGHEGGFELSESVRATMPALITAGVFYGLALLIAVAIAVTAFACRSRLPVLILSGAGLLCMIGVFIAFKQFALPYTSGAVGVNDIGAFGSGILASLIGAALKITDLRLSTGAIFSAGAFVVVLLWTGAFMLVDLGDKDAAKVKKPVHHH